MLNWRYFWIITMRLGRNLYIAKRIVLNSCLHVTILHENPRREPFRDLKWSLGRENDREST